MGRSAGHFVCCAPVGQISRLDEKYPACLASAWVVVLLLLLLRLAVGAQSIKLPLFASLSLVMRLYFVSLSRQVSSLTVAVYLTDFIEMYAAWLVLGISPWRPQMRHQSFSNAKCNFGARQAHKWPSSVSTSVGLARPQDIRRRVQHAHAANQSRHRRPSVRRSVRQQRHLFACS